MSEYRNPNTYKNFIDIMAVVHQYIIIYFTLVIQDSMSISIKRELCLETVTRFMKHEDNIICDFDLGTALDILQDVATCPRKCSFRIYNLNCDDKYSLRRINLTIGNTETLLNPCLTSYPWRSLFIDCSSWNAVEYIHGYLHDANSCLVNNAQCVYMNNYCICHCMAGHIVVDDKCQKKIMVYIGGTCEFDWQCNGTKFANVCDHNLCSCSPGYIQIDRKCYLGNLELNDSCELSEQCIQPFSVCFKGKCKCLNGYFASNKENCIKETVPVGGFCSFNEQCTGSNDSGICEHRRCVCAKEYTLIDLACKKGNLQLNDPCEVTKQCTQPFSVCFNGKCKCINGYSAFGTDSCIKDQTNSLGIGSSNSQQHGTTIGVTLGSLFGGFILGVIVTSVVTTLMYRRLKFQTRKRQEPDVMFAENREYGTAGGARISFTNNKKQNVAKLSPYSFSKETEGYNLSRKQEDERTEDVYNHLHEQTEQDDDTYDHACAATNHSADLSDYSNIRDTTTVRPTSPSTDGDDYSTLRH